MFKSKYDQRIFYLDLVQTYLNDEFLNCVKASIENAQKKKLIVEVKYSTEMTDKGICHNALIIGRLNKKR